MAAYAMNKPAAHKKRHGAKACGGQGDAVSGQRVHRLGQFVVRGIGDAHAVGLGFTPSTRANWIRLSITAYTKITLYITG
jgi:hypothetical protein